MAWKKRTDPAATKHNPNCIMAFGRLSPQGCCPRCDELHNGSPARAGWNDAKLKAEQQRSEAMKHHFAPGGPADQIRARGGVDTAFEW